LFRYSGELCLELRHKEGIWLYLAEFGAVGSWVLFSIGVSKVMVCRHIYIYIFVGDPVRSTTGQRFRDGEKKRTMFGSTTNCTNHIK
jgi:hypothetical protein